MKIQIPTLDLDYTVPDDMAEGVDASDPSQAQALVNAFREEIQKQDIGPDELEAILDDIENARYSIVEGDETLYHPATVAHSSLNKVKHYFDVPLEEPAGSGLGQKVRRYIQVMDEIRPLVQEANQLEQAFRGYSADQLTEELASGLQQAKDRLEQAYNRQKQATEKEIERLQTQLREMASAKEQGEAYLNEQEEWVKTQCRDKLKEMLSKEE